jgi:outer membrane murein-binding lipoprotein Lpp
VTAADGFDVRVERLRTASTDLDAVADQLAGSLDGMAARQQGNDDAFGGDDIGQLIGGAYAAIVEFAFDRFGAVVEDLRYYAEGVAAMAANYQAADDEAAAGADRIGSELGP